MKLKLTSVLGASAIILGAFGAHALTDLLSKSELSSFKTGVFYHLTHAVYLLGLVILEKNMNVKWPFYLAFTGILFFSGSIYLLSLDHLLGLDLSFLWPVTPIGGLLLVSSWLSLFNLKKTSN